MNVSGIKLPPKMAAETLYSRQISPPCPFVYNGITPAITIAMGHNIKGRLWFFQTGSGKMHRVLIQQ
jgi:hypothetical protein